MVNKSAILPFIFILFLLSLSLVVKGLKDDDDVVVVRRDQRRSILATEDGEISAADITIENRGPYHIQFITLAPNSWLLPQLLHAEMVFYVHSGSGRLSWVDNDDIRRMKLRKGDVHRLPPGCVFYVQSSLETEREKLRIYAIFSNTDEGTFDSSIGVSSSISDLLLGFDKRVLQAAFKAPEDILEELTSATRPPAILHALAEKKKNFWEHDDTLFLRAFLGGRGGMPYIINSKTKKGKGFNIFDAKKDVDNCNGWCLTVNRKDLHTLEDSNIGVFMVNLTKGAMMGPHWNPRATEVAIVLQGQGMIRTVCSTGATKSECKNMRFRVKEGDVFAIPRFHPMAQMSFNNDSFVFVGFSTATSKNYPQFLAGKKSVLQMLDQRVLGASLNVSDTIIHQFLASQEESIILECTSCAEEEERIMEEKEEKKRKAREREEEEEEERRRQEEKRREEEEARREEEERERKRREEARKEEEERKREEEARREEEEARRQEEEREKERREEARKEEEERKREEEARREEEEARRQEEEREKKRREEEERRKREEEAKREEEEEEEEEEERQRKKREQEEERKREEEKRGEEEEKERREREREREREEEEYEERRIAQRKRREEVARREQEEAMRQEEKREKRVRKEEERAAEEEARREEEEEEEEEVEPPRKIEEQEAREREQEEARRQEDERQLEAEEEEEGITRSWRNLRKLSN